MFLLKSMFWSTRQAHRQVSIGVGMMKKEAFPPTYREFDFVSDYSPTGCNRIIIGRS